MPSMMSYLEITFNDVPASAGFCTDRQESKVMCSRIVPRSCTSRHDLSCLESQLQDWSKIAQLLNHQINAFQILSTLLGYGLPLAHQIPKNLQRSDPNLLVPEQVVDSWASCTPKWSQLATHHSDSFGIFRSLGFHWVFLSQEAKIDEHISHPAQLKLEASEIMQSWPSCNQISRTSTNQTNWNVDFFRTPTDPFLLEKIDPVGNTPAISSPRAEGDKHGMFAGKTQSSVLSIHGPVVHVPSFSSPCCKGIQWSYSGHGYERNEWNQQILTVINKSNNLICHESISYANHWHWNPLQNSKIAKVVLLRLERGACGIFWKSKHLEMIDVSNLSVWLGRFSVPCIPHAATCMYNLYYTLTRNYINHSIYIYMSWPKNIAWYCVPDQTPSPAKTRTHMLE